MATILCIAPYAFLPADTGGKKNVALFYQYLGREENLICVSVKKNDPGMAGNFLLLPVLSDSSLRYINPLLFFRIRKLLKQYGATHLLLEHPYYGWLGVLLKTFCGVKLLIHSHNIEGKRWKSLGKWWWRILWQYEKFTHRRANGNFFIQDEDLAYAIAYFHLRPSTCIKTTYGTGRDSAPKAEERKLAKKTICSRHHVDSKSTILLFNGAFNYAPNLEALNILLRIIFPALRQMGFQGTLLICGKNIPVEITESQNPGVVFAGFVNDIDPYFLAADLFVNPVIEGGGIKTKLVEALAAGCSAVSVQSGAAGIDPVLCKDKLFICADGDWPAFIQLVMQAGNFETPLPSAFYAEFFWGNIAHKTSAFIRTLA